MSWIKAYTVSQSKTELYCIGCCCSCIFKKLNHCHAFSLISCASSKLRSKNKTKQNMQLLADYKGLTFLIRMTFAFLKEMNIGWFTSFLCLPPIVCLNRTGCVLLGNFQTENQDDLLVCGKAWHRDAACLTNTSPPNGIAVYILRCTLATLSHWL